MLSGDFERKLRKLNPDIRIYCSNDDSKPAGIFWVKPNGEYQEICGIDKNQVPEWPTFDETGAYVKAGWRRALKILINKGFIDRDQAERLFGVHLEYKVTKPVSSAKRWGFEKNGLSVVSQGGHRG
jgi:hypothetical protein